MRKYLRRLARYQMLKSGMERLNAHTMNEFGEPTGRSMFSMNWRKYI